MLRIHFTNDGTGRDGLANYDVEVLVNREPIWSGRVEGHVRDEGWARLVGLLAEQQGGGSPYCPTCGACGEEGCCPPDQCKHLACYYGEKMAKTYQELLAENEKLRQAATHADQALCDAMTLYAPEMSGDKMVKAVLVRAQGGTLAYYGRARVMLKNALQSDSTSQAVQSSPTG